MKKIIATVLAMVMALALCTTAFAAEQKYDVFGKNSSAEVATEVTLTYEKADKDANQIAYYTLTKMIAGESEGTTVNQFEGKYFVKADKAADATYVLKYAGKTTVAMYLTEVVSVIYNGEGTAYTNLGTKCGQFDYKAANYTKTDKFFTAVDEADDETYLFVKVATEDIGDNTEYLMVNGVMTAVERVDDEKTLDELLVPHTWVVDLEKLTAKCSACGATGKAYEYYTEVPSGATAELAAGVWVVADKTAGTKPADGTSSPKTFDAGIAMYVGMALTSVAGSALVIGKKKEF